MSWETASVRAQLQVELEIDMKMGNSWFETK